MIEHLTSILYKDERAAYFYIFICHVLESNFLHFLYFFHYLWDWKATKSVRKLGMSHFKLNVMDVFGYSNFR